jgi:hypothetical protein
LSSVARVTFASFVVVAANAPPATSASEIAANFIDLFIFGSLRY